MVFVYQVWFHPWKIIQQEVSSLNLNTKNMQKLPGYFPQQGPALSSLSAGIQCISKSGGHSSCCCGAVDHISATCLHKTIHTGEVAK